MKKNTMFIAAALILLNLQTYSQTWTVLSSGTTEGLYGIFATSANEVHTAGNNGIVLKSTDQGTTWNTQYNGTCNFRTIFFTNTADGYIAGGLPIPTYLSYIYKTTDGGTSWTLQENSSPSGLYSLYFPNLTTGYCVGGNAGTVTLIFKSTDSGNSWTNQTAGITQSLYDVYFTDANTGFAVGISGVILKTTDGGISWSKQTSGTNNNLYSVYFADSNTGYAVGASGTVIKTSDGGTTWSLIPVSGITKDLWSVYFFNENHGMAVGASGTIIETNDGGTTWTQYLGVTTRTLRSVHFFSQNIAYAYGDGTQTQSSARFLDQTIGYACGDNGTIIKYTSAIGVNEIENLPVCNAFPNPANDQLTVNLSGKNISNVNIAISNELGQNVFEVQENTPSGHYTKTIDTRALAAGIYFISVTTEKSKWTKKISISH